MKPLLLALVAACTTAPTSIDGILVRDPSCGPTSSDDCFELVDGAIALPSEPFELVVHGDDLGAVTLRANGAPVDAIETDRTVTPAGTDVTLLVSPLPYGRIDLTSGDATATFDALDPHASADYGSTYSSNCSCIFCTKYCDVNGTTTKSGVCC